MKQVQQIEPKLGSTFSKCVEHAQSLATKDTDVSFEFNGINVVISRGTDPALIYRDYVNSHLMGWKTIGPDCDYQYSSKILFEMAEKTKIREERHRLEEEEYKAKSKEKTARLQGLIDGIEFAISDSGTWEEYKAKNKDDYGKAILRFAENWAKVMQRYMAYGELISDCADKASNEADVEGISGAMYGAAVKVLSQVWANGDILRTWHNNKYKHSGDGVVNPAIMTVNIP